MFCYVLIGGDGMKKIKLWFLNIKNILKNIGFLSAFSWKIGKGLYFISIISIVLGTVTPFVYLYFPKFIIDELAGACRWDVVLKYIFGFLITVAVIKVISFLFSYFSAQIQRKISLRSMLYFVRQFAWMDYENLENDEIQNLGSKCSEKIDASHFVNGVVVPFFTTAFQLAGYTYIIVQLHPLMVAFLLLIILVNAFISKRNGKLDYEFQTILTKFTRRLNYLYRTMIQFDYGKDVRINETDRLLIHKYEQETGSYFEKYTVKQNKEKQMDLVRLLVNSVQMLAIYGYASLQAITGAITVGNFSVYLGAITNFTSSFTTFVNQIVSLKYESKYVDDYKEYLKKITPKDESYTHVDLPKTDRHEIEFVHVSFRYPNTERYVLKDINLKIHSGERLSIVGYNGAGKSTLIKLICRLYEPTQGCILYNGIDIRNIEIEKYRTLISVVFQDFQLFSFSIKDNVILNQPENEERIEYALEKSGLSEKIEGLEKGIDTIIGREFDEDGLEFSGGEGQKLACARAYYKDSPIMILDEPTASLDPISECQLYERFNSILENKTAIYISHRLASVKFCNKVAMFADGRLAEYGTHESLMEQNGLYAEMFTKQAEYYRGDTKHEE